MNKIVLSNSSKLLAPIFASTFEFSNFTSLNYDILCPDFDPDAMSMVLELVFTGKTSIDTAYKETYEELKIILKALQINIVLPKPRYDNFFQ